jgi:dethiobiotin synthetase
MGHYFFISGIGTDVGKTVVSAIIAEALQANYWKPVQAGDLENSDSIKIKRYCSEKVTILPELFKLKTPVSPHYAAELDKVNIKMSDFVLPEVEGNLIIEGAGGLMVPINMEGLLYLDVLQKWNLPVILVSRHYLGSINHTMMSLEILKQNKIKLELLVFIGDENPASESIILKKYPSRNIRIPLVQNINKEFIINQAAKFNL